MKTKATVDEALARLSRAIDRPWDARPWDGALPSYADTDPPLTRLINRWTKPTDRGRFSGRLPDTPAQSPENSDRSAFLSSTFGRSARRTNDSTHLAHRASEPGGLARRATEPDGAYRATEPGGLAHRVTESGLAHRASEPGGLAHRASEFDGLAYRATEPGGLAHLAPEPGGLAYPTDDPDLPSPRRRETSTPSSGVVRAATPSRRPSDTTDRFPALALSNLNADLSTTRSLNPESSRSASDSPNPDTDDFSAFESSHPDAEPPSNRTRRTRRRMPRSAAIIAVLAGALVAGMIALPGAQEAPAATPPPAALQVDQPKQSVTVDIQGKVTIPGVHHLPDGSRVIDAIAASGGTVPGTNTSTLNLARLLVDGEQIHVGTTPPPAAANPAKPPLTNLNTAPVYQLDALPGVGIVTAQRILEYRNRHGRFTEISQLRQIEGIGPARYDKLKDLVTVN